MDLHIKTIGVLLMTLALIHIGFPKYFKWKENLASLSLINRQMMIVHTFFIALTVFLMGLLCFVCTTEMMQTNLGKSISLGLGIFWAIRLVIQIFGYSNKLWKGKLFETTMHIIFSALWAYLTIIFFLNASS
jgi:hypothetical protein